MRHTLLPVLSSLLSSSSYNLQSPCPDSEFIFKFFVVLFLDSFAAINCFPLFFFVHTVVVRYLWVHIGFTSCAKLSARHNYQFRCAIKFISFILIILFFARQKFKGFHMSMLSEFIRFSLISACAFIEILNGN